MRQRYSNDGGSFLMLRDEHLLITGGNVVAAALIHIFEHWHYHKQSQNQQNREANDIAAGHNAKRSFTETLYQWHTSDSLERQLKGLGRKDSIIKARKILVELGIISEHKNPNPAFHYDKTVHFLFYPNVLAELINNFDKNRITSSENRQAPPLKTDETSSENRQYPYISSIDNFSIDNDISAANAPGDKKSDSIKKTDSRKKTPGAQTDGNWQRWVDRYEDHVKHRNEGIGHRWDGAQLGPQGLKGLRQHLVKVAIKQEGISDDDCGFGAFCYILDHWDRLGNDWLHGQFDLTVILKKITDILNRLKNGTNTNRGTNTSGNGKISPGAARFEAIKNY